MTTSEFWQNLDFDEITTFSICRNEVWKAHRLTLLQRYVELYHLCKSPNLDIEEFIPKRTERDFLFMKGFYSEHWVGKPPHIDEQGKLTHPFGSIVANLAYSSEHVKTLEAILNTDIKGEGFAMCWPVYREGILFYKDRKLVTCLDVCLGCWSLENNGERLQVDMTVYERLRNWFMSLGHQIDSDREENEQIKQFLIDNNCMKHRRFEE